MAFITSSKGGRKLVITSYIYCKNKSLTNGSSCWECEERRSKNGCKARVTLDENEEIIKGPSEHKHPPKPEKYIGDQLQGASGERLAKLPKLDTLRRCVRRQRQEQGRYPPIPNGPNFNIPQEYAIIGEEQFFQYANGREDRILIFGTRDSLDYLENSRNWFRLVSRPQFAQLYIVHGLQNGRNVVGAYTLLPSKRLDSYAEMLNEIKNLTNGVNPESIMINFENSMISVCERVYPLVPKKAFLFPLTKNIYRKVQQSGLAQEYINNE